MPLGLRLVSPCIEFPGQFSPASTSPRAPHLKFLPSTHNCTVLWSPDEVEQLQGSSLHYLTRLLQQQCRGDYEVRWYVWWWCWMWRKGRGEGRGRTHAWRRLYMGQFVPQLLDAISSSFTFSHPCDVYM